MGIADLRKRLAGGLPNGARADTLRMDYQPKTGRQILSIETAAGTATVVAEPRATQDWIINAIREAAASKGNEDGDQAEKPKIDLNDADLHALLIGLTHQLTAKVGGVALEPESIRPVTEAAWRVSELAIQLNNSLVTKAGKARWG